MRHLAAGALIASLSFAWAATAFAISSHTLITQTGAATGDQAGISVAPAGDVNGDGFPDLIVGARGNDAGGADAGRAYVHFGGPVVDAVPDLILTGALAGDAFGHSVAGAGDVNADGFDDLIVGAYLNDAAGSNAGRAYVFFGGSVPDATPDLTLTGAALGDNFGASVASAGDVNGDGHADVIVGAFQNDAMGVDAGRAYVYYGGSTPDATVDLTLSGAAAGDKFGVSVSSAGDMNGDGYGDLIVGASGNDAGGVDAGRAYIYHGGFTPNATADLVLTGEAAGDVFGVSTATAGDVNGDGYSDVIVGASVNDAGGLNAGRAYVYYGGPVADANRDLTLTGAAAGDFFGFSVASAGDVNGDGCSDLIVGAPFNDAGGTSAGRAYVYFGGLLANPAADLVLTGAISDFFSGAVAPAGDVNGDGYDDLFVGASDYSSNTGRAYVVAVYPYQLLSPNGGEQWVAGRPATVRWRGHDVADVSVSFDGGATWSVRAAGIGGQDENEYTLTAPGPATSLAKLRVSYSGQSVSRATSDESDGVFRIAEPATPPAAAQRLQFTPTGAAANDLFGISVASAGDMNGDGFADLVVGAHLNDAGGSNAGRAYLYHGGPGADAVADLTLTGAAAGDLFGVSVASAGDVNGDGFSDLIVGALFNDAGAPDVGRAYVYYGGLAADAVADLTLTGAGANDRFGQSVASAGDVNGDGFADLIVGANFNDAGGADAGRAYIYYGGPAPDAVADLTLTGAATGDRFGQSVASAGDRNGDGFADVIVGANFNDAGGTDAGRAYIYHGGPVPDAIPDFTLTGAAAGDAFGVSVAGAGDLDGDGFSEVVVGASFNDAGGAEAGRAYVYYGGPAAGASPGLILTGAAAGDNFGASVAGAGDVNGDGFPDLVVGASSNDAAGAEAGRAYIYYGGPGGDGAADLVLDGPGPATLFGVSAASAGDVTGDGFADVIVGAIGNSAGGVSAGRACVYDSERYFVLSPNDDEVWNVGASRSVSWLGAEPADLWLSLDAGRTWDLLRHDVGGEASNFVSLLVPHAPTRFARVRVTPADPGVRGLDESDSTFTIQSSVALLNLSASLTESGAELTWSTDPGVGPDGLAGYRLYRLGADREGSGQRIGPDLVVASRYTDPAGAPGHAYRLAAVNGLGEELELGRVATAPAAPLAAWPLPYRGGTLNVSFTTVGALGEEGGKAEVLLFDLSGRLVRSLARGRFSDGHPLITWDGRVGSSRVDLQACKLEYSIVSPK